jgi:hypothetical protein
LDTFLTVWGSPYPGKAGKTTEICHSAAPNGLAE